MAGQLVDFNPVSRITIGTVGSPGQRVFLLQASQGVSTITLKIEKEQARILASSVIELLEGLNEKYPRSYSKLDEPLTADLMLQEPVDPDFVVGQIGLGYDQDQDLVVLVVQEVQFEDVDVITTATKGLMSGITGIFSFRLAAPKTIRKFVEVSINGIEAYPGPCPNEFLGIIDLIVYGTGHSKTIENYSGGMLFRDLVEGKIVNVVAKSVEGEIIQKELTLKDMQFARLMGTRQAIKNYNAMINPTTEKVNTIFSALPFEPNNNQITFSGCGALNPFQNDPDFRTFGIGMPVLVNGSIGHLIGPGTRNSCICLLCLIYFLISIYDSGKAALAYPDNTTTFDGGGIIRYLISVYTDCALFNQPVSLAAASGLPRAH